jgi:hypothetical protein
MGSGDHVIDAAQDLAFTKGLSGGRAADSDRYLRRRLAAVLWIPATFVAILVGGAWLQNWALAVGLVVVESAGLAFYSEGPGRLWARS